MSPADGTRNLVGGGRRVTVVSTAVTVNAVTAIAPGLVVDEPAPLVAQRRGVVVAL
ncbi:hypothetical protein [Streptomyces herbicida]|uniref:hypothetical protein n=1 Tax=Streptomyces herbicida TaxID=3065675 RepID=UPI00292F04E0|nr:hypothetical protein [Streptomyces sp. NEAU-HV9]